MRWFIEVVLPGGQRAVFACGSSEFKSLCSVVSYSAPARFVSLRNYNREFKIYDATAATTPQMLHI